jgi:hypothetical protein
VVGSSVFRMLVRSPSCCPVVGPGFCTREHYSCSMRCVFLSLGVLFHGRVLSRQSVVNSLYELVTCFYLDPARFEWSWGVSPAKKNSCLLCLHPLNISLSKSNDRLSIGLNNVHRRSASSLETQKRVARQVLSKD